MRPAAYQTKSTACIFFLLLWFGCERALALDPGREVSEFNAQSWVTENGLPQNSVHAIIQAGDGYVWIATEEGLARFDASASRFSTNRIRRS